MNAQENLLDAVQMLSVEKISDHTSVNVCLGIKEMDKFVQVRYASVCLGVVIIVNDNFTAYY